jgi:acetylornithine deacetylase/succinyl-diaminopimelate desuccinylase-like protein
MRRLALATLLACTATIATAAPAPTLSAARSGETMAMFEKLINTPTVIGRGQVPGMATYLADQYKAHGFAAADVMVVPYDTGSATTGNDKTAALIVRWRAAGKAGKKPILLMGHMDVVEAKREDSTTDPFMLTKRDGYLYGRGTIDMKNGLTGISQALFELKATGWTPKRDLVVFFTGDEETNGIGARKGASEWLDKLGNPEFGLNADGGGGNQSHAGVVTFAMQTAEKTFAGYTLTVRNRGGHSSKPRKDNAIYSLAHAIDKIEAFRFTPMLNETTRAFFSERAKSEVGVTGAAMKAWLANPDDGAAADAVEADDVYVGLTRTRCVPTRLFGGHADNALPQLATALINCRIFPGVEPDQVQRDLTAMIGDPSVVVSREDAYPASLASPLRPDVDAAYKRAVIALHPGSGVSPLMSTGASDARPFRIAGIPVYGVDGTLVVTPDDNRAHGKDERLPVASLDQNVLHWTMMLRDLAGK